MQNEITELRNQVRTLKKIVCLACCLFGVIVFAGCSSWVGNASTWYDSTTLVGSGVSRAMDKNRDKRKSLIGKILDGDDIFSNMATSFASKRSKRIEKDISEMNEAAQSDELCCQHPHHLECIVNTTSSPPGSCQHSHHLECGVITTE